ncbi:ABC transporter ATP-binding protein [Eubacteriales bacterium OttesenSCG-928-A19]|nr:ABC transporter ATP-binding protein [Eubacteriales bacterium OttesenSCG-928-A19]
MNSIEIRGVSKRFGDVTALDGVTLTLEEGRIYGLLGRNGAGKTTLLNTITNRIFASDGAVYINGMPARENDNAQKYVYMMSEKGQYPESMRIDDVFRWTNVFYDGALDMAYADELCQAFGLSRRKKVKQLSTGYSSIYKIITALALDVPFLLLDEPVLGLDANHRDLLYRLMLENYAKNPRTIVLSTHLIEEVSRLIEEVVIIQDGRIIRQAACDELLASAYAVTGPAGAADAYAAGREVIGQDALGGMKTVYILGRPDGAVTGQLELSQPDLQRLFIQLTNQ